MKKLFITIALLFVLSACEEATMKPIIELGGAQDITIEAGSDYIETATAHIDEQEVDIEVVGTVDTTTLGDYTLTYKCEVDGVAADQLTRVIHVVDTTAPTISFLSSGTIELEYGMSLDTIYTIEDNLDIINDITLDVTGENTLQTLGTHDVTFTVSDSQGNTRTVSKTIDVVDTTPPVVTFSEYDTFTHEKGVPFNPNNVLYHDNYDSNENITLHVSGTVDVDTLGTYDITYYAVDSHGNQSDPIVKTVTVVEPDDTLSTHHRFLKDNLTFYNPDPFINGYIHQATETVYGGVLIENGEYQLKYYMFFHNFFQGTKVLNAFEFTCQDGNNVRIDLAENQTDFVFEIPLQCLDGVDLIVTTYAHDDFVSDMREWTATFSFRKEEYLDPVYLLNKESAQGNK